MQKLTCTIVCACRSGSDKTRILRASVFLADIADFEAFNGVWDRWVVRGSAPPRATVQSLLGDPAWRIEVVVTAAAAPVPRSKL